MQKPRKGARVHSTRADKHAAAHVFAPPLVLGRLIERRAERRVEGHVYAVHVLINMPQRMFLRPR